MIKTLEKVLDKKGIFPTWYEICDAYITLSRPDLIFKGRFSADAKKIASSIRDYPELGELYEHSLAHINKESKKALGQYYTPADISTFMAQLLLEHSDPHTAAHVVEPCCGCGSLVVALLDVIDNPWNIASNNLVLCDLDETAVMICKSILIVRYAPQGATVSFDDIASSIGDFLAPDAYQIGKDDIVIANPPYGRDKQNREGYATASIKDLYAPFFEKIVNARAACVITPYSFVGTSKFQPLRDVLCTKCHGDIYSYDNVPSPIFNGRKHGIFNTNTSNSVRASITIMEQGPGPWRISPLLRFSSTERSNLVEWSRDILEKTAPRQYSTGEQWLKIPPGLDKVFTDKNSTIGSLVSSKQTKYVLHVPASPRYFTTASIRPLSRSQEHTLYFDTEEQMAIAYVVINSSIAYGWWRITDGGVNLPSSVLLSTPFDRPDDTAPFVSRMRELEQLEEKYVVVKMNAGKPNENIKFPEDIRDANTKMIASGLDAKTYENIKVFHSNSLAEFHRIWASSL